MKQTFTRKFRLLLLTLSALFPGFSGMGQYITTPLETGRYYCAMAKDNAENIYVVRYNAGVGKYEVVKYPQNGMTAEVLYTGLGVTPLEYPWGIAVADNGDIFVTDPGPAGWQIVKLDASAGYAYSAIQSGRYFSALAVDNGNNLLAMEFRENGANDTYRLVRYPANNESAPGTVVYDGLPYSSGGTSTYPWGIVVDSEDNIYILDFHENSSGGNLIKLSPPAYNAPVIINSGKYFSSLAVDGQNNIYTTESVNGTPVARIMKYTAPVTGAQTGTEMYSGLSIGVGGFYPWGLVVTQGGAMYVNDGGYDVSDANGRLLQLAPTVIRVESVTRAGASPTNATTVDFTVTFSAPVVSISNSAFSPILTGTLTGGSIASVTGWGTVFTVRVNTGTGEGTVGLEVNGSGMSQTISNGPYTAGEIYSIDRTGPTISLVTPPANDLYGLGEEIFISVKYSESVYITGSPYINIDIGGVTRQVAYYGGTSTDNLVFRYVVQAGDDDLDGIGMDQNIQLNGGTIRDQMQNDAPLALGAHNLSGVKVSTAQPTVQLTMTGSSPVNDRFTVTAAFSEPVTDFAVGDLQVTNAGLSGLTTTDNIVYTFTVIPLADGAVTVTLPANRANNAAGTGNAASNTLSVIYDNTAPAITSVDLPATGTYRTGAVLNFIVHYSEAVSVSGGNPFLNIIIGSTTRQAVITGGSGTDALTFSYTVQAGELDANGVTLSANVQLAGSTIIDEAGNNAALTLQNLDADQANVDGVLPIVTSVDVPAAGYYKTNDVLTFTVHMSEDIAATGTPALNLLIGSQTRPAAFTAATSNTLSFSYTVRPGDEDLDGIALPAAIVLNGGSIQDAAGNNADLALQNAGNASAVIIDSRAPTVNISGAVQQNAPFDAIITFSDVVTGFDVTDVTAANADISNLRTTDNIVYTVTVTPRTEGGVALVVIADVAFSRADVGNQRSNSLSYYYDPNPPVVSNVSLPGAGSYKTGDTLTFMVHFSEGVRVNRTPAPVVLPVVIGSTTREVTYAAGSITDSMQFRYVVQNGDLDTDGIVLGANLQTNGTYRITDVSGNDADLTLRNVSANVVKVDGVRPAITSVAVPVNGYYKTGDILTFTVSFSENITGTGTLSLGITVGSTTRQAVLTGGVNNTLTFAYTVQSADLDLDGIAVAANLSLNGGTIRDGVGNDADLALNNPGNTSNVRIYSNAPSVQLTGTPAANAPYTLSVVFNEAVTGFTANDLIADNATVSNLQTSDNTTYTVTVTPAADGPVRLQVPSGVAFNIANTGNTASNIITYTYDGTAPAITAVDVPANGYYKAGTALNFTARYSEVVTVSTGAGTPSLPVMIGTSAVQAAYVSGSGSNAIQFRYTVQNGDMDLDGIGLGAALSLNGSTLRDAAGNNALPALNNVAPTDRVFVNTTRPSVTLSTTAAARVNAPFQVTVTFNEAVTGLAATDFILSNATAGTLQTTDNITYTILVTPTADGTASIGLPADVAVNNGGNGNTASNAINRIYDATAPVIAAGQHFDMTQFTAGTVAGKVAATEAVGTLQNWTIATDGSNGAFTIAADGTISILDAAKARALENTTVTLGLTVGDGLNTSINTPVTIRIVAINKAPVLDAIPDVTMCFTTDVRTIQLTGASATEPAQTYTLTVSSSQDYFDQLGVNAAGLLSYRLKNNVTSGSVTITVTIRDNGGTANGGVDEFSRGFTLTVNSLPVVNIISSKGPGISKGETTELTASGGTSYIWTDAPGIIGTRNSAILQVRPLASPAVYEVTATNGGCSATGQFTLTLVDDFKVDATNILTPNGDGINDRWVVRNLDAYPENEVKIFDRAGHIVFSQRNYSNTWDGTVNGKPLAEGTYYYILIIANSGKVAKGFITIVRNKN